MASAWRRFLIWLGLADEEESEEYAEEAPRYDAEMPPEQPPEREAVPRIRTLEPEEAPSRGAVVRPDRVPTAQVHIIEPTGFNDAKDVGDQLLRNVPVILNLQHVDRDLRRRLLDFASGAVYVLKGHLERAGEHVFVLTPVDVEVSAEEKRRLRDRGLFSGV